MDANDLEPLGIKEFQNKEIKLYLIDRNDRNKSFVVA